MIGVNEGMVVAFMLTASMSYQTKIEPEKTALQTSAQAFYMQSGLEAVMSKSFQTAQDQYIAKPVQYFLANTFGLVTVIREQKIAYTWSF